MGMPDVNQKKTLSVKDGVVSFNFGATHDGDKDGVASVEAGAYIKIAAKEVIKEIIAANDSATMKMIAPYAKMLGSMVPDVAEKEV